MIELLLYIHRLAYGANNRNHYKDHNKLLWLITNVLARATEYVLNQWVRFKYLIGLQTKPNKDTIQEGLIVSLTSFPARINNIYLTIDSIFRQKTQPESINLYLSAEQFPDRYQELPNNLIAMTQKGLNIIFVEEDLKPHKKYFYSFQKYRDKCVVTIDDDVYYRSDLLKHLWSLHIAYPDCVVASQGSVYKSINDKYSTWTPPDKERMTPSNNCVAIGCGGILYPAYRFTSSDLFDKDLIREMSLSTDDLWLKAHEILNDIKVVIGDYFCMSPDIVGSQKFSLSQNNWKQSNKNDENWSKLIKHYGLQKTYCNNKELKIQ